MTFPTAKQPPPSSNPSESATSEIDAVIQRERVDKKLSRDTFAKVRGELTEEEFASPAVSRMLLERISDLESRLQEEKPFRGDFHDADKERAVLQEKFKTRISSEVMFGVCLSAGSVLLSVAPTLPQTSHLPGVFVVTGLLLFAGAIISRIIILKEK